MRRPSLPGGRALLAGWLLALVLVRSGTVTERDPYWQARAGLEGLAGVPLTRPDSWSWAPVDDLFRPTSPGWNLVLGVGWVSAGFWGLFLVSLLTMGAYLWLTVRLARVLGARPLPTLLALLPVFLLAIAWFSPRATLAAQALLALGLLLPVWWSPRAARASRPVNLAVAAAAGLALSWTGNAVHLSWLLLAAGMALAWAVFWVLVPGVDGGRRAALAVGGGAGLLAGTLASPYGLAGGIEHSARTQRAAAGLLLEWAPAFGPGVPANWPIAALVALAAAAGLVWRLGRGLRARGRSLPLALGGALAVLAVPAALAGLLAIRFVGTALLLLAPALAAALTGAVGRVRLPALLAHWATGHFWRVVLTWTLVVLSPAVVLQAWPHGVPTQAAITGSLPSGCRLFSDADTGSVVVLLRPDVPVWQDGRADYYGRERLLAAARYLAGLGETTVPEGTGCVVLADADPRAAGAVARLDADPAWRRGASAGGFTLWLPGPS